MIISNLPCDIGCKPELKSRDILVVPIEVEPDSDKLVTLIRFTCNICGIENSTPINDDLVDVLARYRVPFLRIIKFPDEANDPGRYFTGQMDDYAINFLNKLSQTNFLSRIAEHWMMPGQ